MANHKIHYSKATCNICGKFISINGAAWASHKRTHNNKKIFNFINNIGKKVMKCSITDNKLNNKAFKSGLLINTIKDIIIHPTLKIPAYIFGEDDSYVECRRCKIINN
jgi:hypothetical protein